MAGLIDLPVQRVVDAPAIIIDGRLALSPLGLLFALRVARSSRRAWLPCTWWALLDNDTFFQAHPEVIDDHGNGAVKASMLQEWRLAWMHANLLDQFWWIGEGAHESLLPGGIDVRTVDRFHLLTAWFDRRCKVPSRRPLEPLSDCARDAVVLAAVLTLYSPVILTVPDDDDGEPRLCTLVREAGLTCREVEGGANGAEAAASLLSGTLGLAAEQLAMAGLRLAAVHILAPRAIVAGASEEAEFDWDERIPGDPDRDPWDDAVAIWHRLY